MPLGARLDLHVHPGHSLLPASDLVGSRAAHRLEMGSVFTMGCLLLLGGLFWLRPRIVEPERLPSAIP